MELREPTKINLKYIMPLALLYLTIYLAADSVAYKMVSLGKLLEPGPPFIFPLSYVIADIIAEVYGYTIAKRLIWLTLFFQLLYALIVTTIIKLPYPDGWKAASAYDQVFGHILIFVIAGSMSVLISSFVNVYAISKWKIVMKGKHFWLRSVCASAIGGFLLVFIIIIFGYSWTMDFKSAIVMFFSIYLLELLYSLITIWPASLLAGFLKFKENLNVYDTKINYNPFSF